jgi:hypothetical protein
MNQIRSVLVAFASAAVITGAAGCGTSSTPHPTTSNAPSVRTAATTSAAATGAQPGCADLGGTVDADQICHVKSAASNYFIDMSFPLDYPDQQAVTDLLTDERDRFLDWMGDFGPQQRRNQPYQLVVTAKTYRSGTPTAGTQSLVAEISDDTGAAHQGHPNTTFKALNYDLTKRAPITFDTLFKPGTNPLEVLNPIVQRELVHGLDYQVNDLNMHTYRNFAITDDAVIFFFGHDEVVRDNNGPHQVSVPRADLAPLLA